MAKRFMDNTIFDKSWYRKLPVRLKIVWFYLINKCNHAGIWECDVDLLSFQIGDEYTLEEILEAFGDNLKEIGDNKIYITKFIEFQYGLPLNRKVKVHQSVLKLLDKSGIELANPLLSVKDKDKDKGKDINVRLKDFADRVEKELFDLQLDPQMVKDFIEYWTEHNTDGRVLRYEQKSIFNIRKRMATWKKNAVKFNSNSKFPVLSDDDIAKREARIEADYKAQQQRFKKADEDVASDDDRKKALGIN